MGSYGGIFTSFELYQLSMQIGLKEYTVSVGWQVAVDWTCNVVVDSTSFLVGGITGQKREFIYIITEKAAVALQKRSESYYVDLRRCLDRTSCCRKPFGFGLVIGQIWFWFGQNGTNGYKKKLEKLNSSILVERENEISNNIMLLKYEIL